MTEEQRYLFDTFGYLVLPDVLTGTQVEELRTTLRQPTEQFEPVAQAEGPLHWGKVWRDLLDLPTLTPVLEEVIGNHAVRERRARAELPDMPTFRLDHVNVHTHVSEGFPGSSLHGGWKGTGGAQFFVVSRRALLQRPGIRVVRALRHLPQQRWLRLHSRFAQIQPAPARKLA